MDEKGFDEALSICMKDEVGTIREDDRQPLSIAIDGWVPINNLITTQSMNPKPYTHLL